MKPIYSNTQGNKLTDQTVFRRLFDHMMSCEPRVPVTRALFDNVQAWALKIEHGDPIEIGNESWSAVFERIVWGNTGTRQDYFVGAAVLDVYGRFAEMTLQEWGLVEVRLPPGVALTALARLQPEPLVEHVEGPPMSVRLLPAARKILGLQGSAPLSCPPFDVELATRLFSNYYFGIDTWNDAYDIAAFFKPFDRSEDEGDLVPPESPTVATAPEGARLRPRSRSR